MGRDGDAAGAHRPRARRGPAVAAAPAGQRGRLPRLPQGPPRLRQEEVRGAAGPGDAAHRVEPARALDKVADRTGSRDLRLFATAVDISQQTGGSLADITENVGQTVRARVEARKTIKSKTSLNRIESQIMVGLPVFMMAALLAISPSHREFYSQPSGWALIALAVVLDALAYLMRRKMGDVKLD